MATIIFFYFTPPFFLLFCCLLLSVVILIYSCLLLLIVVLCCCFFFILLVEFFRCSSDFLSAAGSAQFVQNLHLRSSSVAREFTEAKLNYKPRERPTDIPSFYAPQR
jgi:hypothetical protein